MPNDTEFRCAHSGDTWLRALPAAIAAALLGLFVLLVAGGAEAQVLPDYGIFDEGDEDAGGSAGSSTGTGTEDTGSGTSSPPLGSYSLPGGSSGGAGASGAAAGAGAAAASGAAGGPGLDDYAAIADYSPDPVLSRAQQQLQIFFTRVRTTFERAPAALDEILLTLAVQSPTGEASYFLGVFLFALLLLAVGRAMSSLFAVYVARPVFVRQQRPDPVGLTDKIPVLALRLLLTFAGVIVVLATAAAIGVFFYNDHEGTLLTVNVVFLAYALMQIADTTWRVLLAPYLSPYRVPRISDRGARRLYHSIGRATNFAIVTMAFCVWIEQLGLAREIHVIVTVGLSFLSMLAFMVVILRNHSTVGDAIRGGKGADAANWISFAASRAWAPAVALYLVIAWIDQSYRLVMGLDGAVSLVVGGYVTLLIGLFVYGGTSFLIERAFTRSREARERQREADARRAEEDAELAARIVEQASRGDSADTDGDGDEEGAAPAQPPEAPPSTGRPRRPGMQTMEDLARRAASLFALGAAIYALLTVWGGPDVFKDNATLDAVQNLVDTLFLGYIAYHAVRIWMDTKIAEEVVDDGPQLPGEGEGGGAGASRLATLLPLVRSFILAMIAVAVVLTVASQMGINVAPLFAGAGVVGLAIGFGSQTLVRDILSGAFFLMDDAFRKGEYIDVGNVKGTVEKISLRSFQLRHHLGMLHTIPFGEIQFLTNFSRDWVMMKLPLRLTYDTDVEKVRKLIKKLGQRLLDDPEIGENFLQPLKSQGVYMMEDSAMIIRVKFMTKPGDQWVVRKKVYAEIRELFEKEGIKFAHREVTVRIPGVEDNKELSDEQRQAIGAAARRATDAVDEEMMQGGPAMADAR